MVRKYGIVSEIFCKLRSKKNARPSQRMQRSQEKGRELLSRMFRVATSLDDLLKAFAVRSVVFMAEEGIPYTIERDGHDYSAIHVLGEEQGEPFAAGRIRPYNGYAKLERISVRKAYRGKNLGIS